MDIAELWRDILLLKAGSVSKFVDSSEPEQFELLDKWK
jgi:hypothetical protein